MTFLIILCFVFASAHSEKIPLHIAALQEWSNTPFFYKFPIYFQQVIDYGLKEINNHSEILVDYDLQFVYRDTKVSKKKFGPPETLVP